MGRTPSQGTRTRRSRSWSARAALSGRLVVQRRRRLVRVTAALAGVVVIVPLLPADALGPVTVGEYRIENLAPVREVVGHKSESSRLAQTDPSLVGIASPALVDVLVKLDYDAAAVYEGGVAGLEATSPEITGRPLTLDDPALLAFDEFAAGVEERFENDLGVVAPGADVIATISIVYGGVAASVPGDQIDDILAIDGVVAVQRNELQHVLTETPTNPESNGGDDDGTDPGPLPDSGGGSPTRPVDPRTDLIGSSTVIDWIGGPVLAGRGVTVGVLDSGVWPEHPSFVASPLLAGFERPDVPCQLGDNPLTAEADPFACNAKLVGARASTTFYDAAAAQGLVPPDRYPGSARDGDGHGTHTATTAAGARVEQAPVLGLDRGPVQGVAPGAQLVVYKVCGPAGCYASDTMAAVEQAILDGVDVINYSISGGKDPFNDPTELAFLDAYAAGIFVSASAGNGGPTAASVQHLAPWVTSVAVSTLARGFTTTVHVESAGEATIDLTGASIHPTGLPVATPIVRAPGDGSCRTPLPPETFHGEIVICLRDPLGSSAVVGRVRKGINVKMGGAGAMVLVNPDPGVTVSDSHVLPTVHLDQATGAQLLAFLLELPASTASFAAGSATSAVGDQIAEFSSRGPGGPFLKPDLTAPGVEVLAGHSPTPAEGSGGPSGEYFQSLSGTSMSASVVAGAAALIRAKHRDWTPGQIQSALATTATSTVALDGTASSPFDQGSGRVDLPRAAHPGLTISATHADFLALGSNPLTQVDLNLASIHATVMPGSISTTRTAVNVSGRTLSYSVETATSDPGVAVSVSPSSFTVEPGASVTLAVTVEAPGVAPGRYFGEIRITEQWNGAPALHLPVAFDRTQGGVSLATTCRPVALRLRDTARCTVTAQNQTFGPADVKILTTADRRLRVHGAEGAERIGTASVGVVGTLPGVVASAPSLVSAGPSRFVDLATIPGLVPLALGDESAIDFPVPSYVYGDHSYTTIGIISNGYAVVGGANGVADIAFEPQMLPDAARPNNVLAPFWTDLEGHDGKDLWAATLTDASGRDYVVFQWNVHLYGDRAQTRVFQLWIGLNGVEEIAFAYDPVRLPAPPAVGTVTVGAENSFGNRGAVLDPAGRAGPTADLAVVSTLGSAGGRLSYTVTLTAVRKGVAELVTLLNTPVVRGVTVDVVKLSVTGSVGWRSTMTSRPTRER